MDIVLIILLTAIAIVFVALLFCIVMYIKGPSDSTDDAEEDEDVNVIRYDADFDYDYSLLTNNLLQQTVSFPASAQDVIYSLIFSYIKKFDITIDEIFIANVTVDQENEIGELELVSNGNDLLIRVVTSPKVSAGYLMYNYED